jgi:hypothetical protein
MKPSGTVPQAAAAVAAWIFGARRESGCARGWLRQTQHLYRPRAAALEQRTHRHLVLAGAKVALEEHQAMCGQQLGCPTEQQRKTGVAEPARPGGIAGAERVEQDLLDFIFAAHGAAIARGERACQPGLAAGRGAGDQQQPRFGASCRHRASHG